MAARTLEGAFPAGPRDVALAGPRQDGIAGTATRAEAPPQELNDRGA